MSVVVMKNILSIFCLKDEISVPVYINMLIVSNVHVF